MNDTEPAFFLEEAGDRLWKLLVCDWSTNCTLRVTRFDLLLPQTALVSAGKETLDCAICASRAPRSVVTNYDHHLHC